MKTFFAYLVGWTVGLLMQFAVASCLAMVGRWLGISNAVFAVRLGCAIAAMVIIGAAGLLGFWLTAKALLKRL